MTESLLRRGLAAPIALAGTCALLGLAGLGGWALGSQLPRDDVLGTVSRTTSVPVAAEDFSDLRTVQLTPTLARADELRARRGGVLHRFDCMPGVQWTAGASPVSVAGQPVVLANLPEPLWRDFELGTRGSDVTAFQAFLAERGIAVATTGVFDRQSLVAWRSLRATVGASDPVRGASAGDLIWIPGPTVAIQSCDAGIGETIADGSAIATTVPSVISVSISTPKELLPGRDYLLAFGNHTVPAHENVDDPAFLAALSASADFARWLDDPENQLVRGELRLAQPISVWKLPASAVLAFANGACVVTSDDVIRGTAVASTLGTTLFVPEVAAERIPEEVLVRVVEDRTEEIQSRCT